MFSFCNIIKVNHFLHCIVVFMFFLHIWSLLVPYADVSTKSADFILLSSFEIKAILLISSVKTLCLSLLNLCWVFNINFLFFMNSMWRSLRISVLTLFCGWFCFILIWVAVFIIVKLNSYFYVTFFFAFWFFLSPSLLPFE